MIYCDSAIFIYWVDQIGPFHLRSESLMIALQAAGDEVVIGRGHG
jgi:hypothetical protein